MIQVESLTKQFPSSTGVFKAVDDLSFRVHPGEVFGLLGPNGAGKTTTIRMILGLLRPSSGDAIVDGYRVSRSPDEVKRRIGLVSASTGLYPWLTPREYLQFFGDVYGVDPDHAEDQIGRLAGHFDLNGFLDRRCAVLSTGQTQRVNLARALMHDPPIMLMDEPTRGLDVAGSRVIFDYVVYLRSLGKSVIISTHRLDEAQRLCDRFGLLHRGRLRHYGTLEELRQITGHIHLVEMFFQLLDEPVASPNGSPLDGHHEPMASPTPDPENSPS